MAMPRESRESRRLARKDLRSRAILDTGNRCMLGSFQRACPQLLPWPDDSDATAMLLATGLRNLEELSLSGRDGIVIATILVRSLDMPRT
jgi:hypothetical protein